MKEVKSPKKPLLYYYSIVLIVILLFNCIVSPLLLRAQVEEVDYGTFMRMIEEKNIGEVEVEDDEILFTDKDKQQVYTTGAMDDPTLTQRLYDAGATFTKQVQQTTSPVLSFILSTLVPLLINLGVLALNVALNRLFYTDTGVAAATSLALTIGALAMIVQLFHGTKTVRFIPLMKGLAATAAMSLVLCGGRALLVTADDSKLMLVVKCGLTGFVGCAVYVAVSLILKQDIITDTLKKLRK